MPTDRKIETKDNYMDIPVIEGDELEIHINGHEVIRFIVPYNGHLKCYLSGEKRPILYNVLNVPVEKV